MLARRGKNGLVEFQQARPLLGRADLVPGEMKVFPFPSLN